MSRNKLPHQLSEEELLEQLQNEEKDSTTEIIDSQDDILSYLAAFNITSGTVKITSSVLYKLYKEWSKNPVERLAFGYRLAEILPKEKERYYLINQDSIFLNKELAKWRVIKKKNKVKSPKWHNHFKAFLNHYGLKKGPVYLEGDMIYWLYDKWEYNRGKKGHILNRVAFGSFCKLYLGEEKRTAYSRMYGVSTEIYNHLSPETVLKFRTLKKEHWNETRKKISKRNKEKQLKELQEEFKKEQKK